MGALLRLGVDVCCLYICGKGSSCWSLALSLWFCDRGVLPHTVLLRRVEKLWELVIRWSFSMTKLFARRPIVGVFVVDLEPSFPLGKGQHLEASQAELS